MGSLELPEETLLRYIRLIKSEGLKAKPQFAVKFNKADIPPTHAKAYVLLTPRTSGKTPFCFLFGVNIWRTKSVMRAKWSFYMLFGSF